MKKEFNEEKEKKNELINFINSMDYMNKDISNIPYLNEYENNNEIIDDNINLNNYINEFNNIIEDKNIIIKNEKDLYE